MAFHWNKMKFDFCLTIYWMKFRIVSCIALHWNTFGSLLAISIDRLHSMTQFVFFLQILCFDLNKWPLLPPPSWIKLIQIAFRLELLCGKCFSDANICRKFDWIHCSTLRWLGWSFYGISVQFLWQHFYLKHKLYWNAQ